MIEALAGGLIGEFDGLTIAIIVVVALVTSAIHGATGVAGGFLLAAALAPIIGVKPVVPVMSVALLISHSVRGFLNIRSFNRTVYLNIAVPALPCIIAGSLLYGLLSPTIIAAFLGSVILASIPIRRWAKTRNIRAGRRSLRAAGVMYGGLAGAAVGPGMLLVPFMLGYGLTREAFVATIAMIAFTTNVVRVSVFGSTDLLDENYVAMGILIGLVTIPGNWIGRAFLRRMTNEYHSILVDILTVFGALNFLWLAWRE
jgi:uncharacterized membrane protein YfcA